MNGHDGSQLKANTLLSHLTQSLLKGYPFYTEVTQAKGELTIFISFCNGHVWQASAYECRNPHFSNRFNRLTILTEIECQNTAS